MSEAAGLPTESDVVCRQCGYNLRGLATEGNCPECGTGVKMSMGGDLLRYSSVPWLEKVRLGFTLILWGILAQVVVAVVAWIFLRRQITAARGILFATGLMSLLDVWLITEQDPGDSRATPQITARRVARIALAIALGEWLLLIGLAGLPQRSVAGMVVSVLVSFAGIARIIGEVARLTYIGGLADRIPKAKLAKLARRLRPAYGITMGISVVWALIVRLAGITRGWEVEMTCVAGFFALGFLVVGIVQIVLYFKMRSELREQVLWAKAHWGIVDNSAEKAKEATEVLKG